MLLNLSNFGGYILICGGLPALQQTQSRTHGKVNGCEVAVHAKRIEVLHQFVRQAVPNIRGVPDREALPTLRTADPEYLQVVGVRAREEAGKHN